MVVSIDGKVTINGKFYATGPDVFLKMDIFCNLAFFVFSST